MSIILTVVYAEPLVIIIYIYSIFYSSTEEFLGIFDSLALVVLYV